jgi:hypothetical protein
MWSKSKATPSSADARARPGRVPWLFAAALASAAWADAATLHVARTGDDAADGSRERPFATLAGAQRYLRQSGLLQREPVEVIVHAGTYYLAATLAFEPEDSGTAAAQVIYRSAANEEVILSGGRRWTLTWRPWRDGFMVADTPPDFATDQLFLDGVKLPLARYPNFDPQVAIFGGYAADALAPARTGRWTAPTGGIVHALDENIWGSYHYLITGRAADGSPVLDGGWQTNRPLRMHGLYRFVENIVEELDAPGEWFHDRAAHKLYLAPPAGIDLAKAVVETVGLRELVSFRGSEMSPVRFVSLEGFVFRRAARTFMDTKEPLLRSDWSVYRGGAVFLTGAEDCALARCLLEGLGGNAVFVSGYNRRITVRECVIDAAGASGVLFVGLPSAVRNPLFAYEQRLPVTALDPISGPKETSYPMDCRVEDCIIRHTGRIEKQSAGVQIAMARRIAVVHCSIYGVPRAGINIGDGNWGGHLIEGCDVFDTVLETGDHGSFNSWGRDRYWMAGGATAEQLPALARLDAVEPTVIRRNRWRCDRGWDIDLDDGSSNYEIHENVLLHGGLKLREGFFRRATNNVIVNNTLHPHVWFAGSGDVFAHNIAMTRYRPARMKLERWGATVDENLFTSREADRLAFAAEGCDAHSLAGDAGFVDAARGDFRVLEDSPARRIGFANFPMDAFGVRPPALRALARTPVIPALRSVQEIDAPPVFRWMGASIRGLQPGEFSAFGVPEDAGGVLVADVPAGSSAARAGLRTGDFIRVLAEETVRSPVDFGRKLLRQPANQPATLRLRREQTAIQIDLAPPFDFPEKERDAGR